MAVPEFDIIDAPIDDIYVLGDRRPAEAGAVDRLSGSIQKIGLRTPITIRQAEITDDESGEVFVAYALVVGRHRLEAFRALGRERIPAIVRECDETDARLWEIAENLHRAELTALERDEQVALWVKLNAERISSQPATKIDRGRPEGGVNAAARELGLSKDSAHRAVKVAGLSDAAKEAARASGLDDNRSALLDAARHDTVAEQVAAIHQRAIGKLADDPLNDFEAKEKQVAALMSAWNKASPEAREDFLGRIDTPVFDRSAA